MLKLWTFFALISCLSLAAPAEADPVVINDDAGWCWFQDERAVFGAGKLVAGSVASGSRERSRRGNVEVSSLDLATGAVERFVLAPRLEADDHNAPALLVLPDRRLLAVYAKHGTDREIRYRATTRPADVSAWTGEQSFRIKSIGRGVTYSNLYRLEAEGGRLYDFHRGRGFDPHVIVSDDGGDSWRHGGRLLKGPGRPYVRYASNDVDVVHFVCTEQHPRDFDNSLYHGYVRDGRIHDSFGVEVGKLGGRPVTPERLTRFFVGARDNVAWPADVDLGDDGRLRVVYSAQKDGAGKLPGQGGADHRYRYAWFDGEQWHDHGLAYAGSKLYAGEDDYTGLACLHPGKPGTVYLSADVDPATGAPLISAADGKRHYEIFKAVTADGGVSWSFSAVTSDSSEDQLRPNVPLGGPPGSALIWLRGQLRTYKDYDLEMVVEVPAP